MNAWILASCLLCATPPFEAQPLSGAGAVGPLITLSADRAVLLVDGKETAFDTNQLRTIVATPAPAVVEGTIKLELIDGTTLTATQFTTANGVATVLLAAGPRIQLPVRGVRWVMLKSMDNTPAVLRQWDEVRGGQITSDTLVFRRGEGADAQLDQLEGVLLDVTPENVAFQFDGERNALNRSRVDGLLYLQQAAPAGPAEICQVVDASGSRWRAQSASIEDDRLQLRTLGDVDVRLPLEKIRQIDFAAVNIIYLSDLEWTEAKFTPFIPSQLKEAWFAPRRDQSLQGGPLQLRGRRYNKGLALHSRTEVTYRLREPFQRLRATIGIDDQVRQASVEPNVDLQISGDGKTLFASEVSGSSEPIELDLDISGVRRLTILVDYGRDIDIADHLDLAEARLIR